MSEPKKHHVTIIYGDGIGPEVVTSTRTPVSYTHLTLPTKA